MPGFLIALTALAAGILALERRIRGLQEDHDSLARVFGHVESLMRRRHDALDRLLELAREELPTEWTTLEALESERHTAMTARLVAAKEPGDAAAIDGLAESEAKIEAGLTRLRAASEAAGALRPSSPLLCIFEELDASRERIAGCSRSFDAAVEHFNAALATFPNRLLARPLDLAPAHALARAS